MDRAGRIESKMIKAGSSIVLAYIGVHQIFQLALAAEELGELDTLYCSLLDRPGMWGRYLSRLFKGAMFSPLGAHAIPSHKIRELPRGMLQRKLGQVLRGGGAPNYAASNRVFACDVARRLVTHEAKVFVATETCALESFETAKRLGMTCVLDCPGIPMPILWANIERANEELGIKCRMPLRSQELEARKHAELAMADHVLLCSELQKSFLVRNGVPPTKLSVNALWVDKCFLEAPEARPRRKPTGALRVLYAGPLSIAKGVPYLLEAFRGLKNDCSLTLCGHTSDEVAGWGSRELSQHRRKPRVSRKELVGVFDEHDVLVLPSLGDAFGFIALEAMACGLPVVVTSAVGVPVPAPDWRVPTNCAQSIRERLVRYAHDRELLAADSDLARRFAREHTPERYRAGVADILSQLVASDRRSLPTLRPLG